MLFIFNEAQSPLKECALGLQPSSLGASEFTYREEKYLLASRKGGELTFVHS